MTKIAFDVDGCLIDDLDQPRWDIVQMCRTLANSNEVIVWSGGGDDYARLWGKRLFLPASVTYMTKPLFHYQETEHREYAQPTPQPEDRDYWVDLCFDDMETNYGKVNVKV